MPLVDLLARDQDRMNVQRHQIGGFSFGERRRLDRSERDSRIGAHFSLTDKYSGLRTLYEGRAGTTNTNSTDKAMRPLQRCSVRCQATPERCGACYWVDGKEATSMANGIFFTIDVLQPLRIHTPSGVREAYSGCTGGCDTWHARKMGQTSDLEPTQWCRGRQLARFVHTNTRLRSRGVLLSATRI